MIRAGRVRLNARVCCDPETPTRIERDKIVVDDLPLEPAKNIYLMMNKPRGIVTTASDEKGRGTVYDLLENMQSRSAEDGSANDSRNWVAPVGRLDKASEGLLLLTNDSEWGARVAAPETHLNKTYHVQIAAIADDAFVRALISGVPDGEAKHRGMMRARQAQILRIGKKNCWLEIILEEGKNRQIRRMMAALGVEVLRLVRVAIGPLELGDLAKGTFRALTHDEKLRLDRAMRNQASRATKSSA